MLTTPPLEVILRGQDSIISYLKKISAGLQLQIMIKECIVFNDIININDYIIVKFTNYIFTMISGFTRSWRTKLMLVGLGGAGKTRFTCRVGIQTFSATLL